MATRFSLFDLRDPCSHALNDPHAFMTRNRASVAVRLRILALGEQAAAVLPHRGLEGDAADRIDRVGRPSTSERVSPRSGANASARAPRRHDLAGVAADEQPLAGLPLELHDVQHVFVGRADGAR